MANPKQSHIICRKCNRTLGCNDFYWSFRGKRSTYCKECGRKDSRQYASKLKRLGLCVRCAKPSPSKVLCQSCIESEKERDALKILKKICIQCGNKHNTRYQKCHSCRRKSRKLSAVYWRESSEEFKEKRSLYKKRKRANDKFLVFNAYGGKCVCCGESDWKLLTIDHVFNDGKAHREIVSASELYPYLIRNNFPQDRFRLLCWNCNISRSKYGVCPHEAWANYGNYMAGEQWLQ